MVRKLAAVLIVAALALFGVQPRMTMAVGSASMAPSMEMSGDMPMDVTDALPPCCPDRIPWQNLPCCDMRRAPCCSFHCGAPAQFVAQPSQLVWGNRLEGIRADFGLTDFASEESSAPFRPPRFSILA
jgi:hypothetical protein